MNNKILKLNGIIPDDENENEDKLKSITCPDCGLKNPPTFSFCGNCRMPLNIDVVKNQKDLDTEPDILKIVNNDPEKAKEVIKSLLPMINESIPKEYQKKINEWIES